MTRTVWVCQVANALAAGNLEVAAAYGHQIVSTSNERRRVSLAGPIVAPVACQSSPRWGEPSGGGVLGAIGV